MDTSVVVTLTVVPSVRSSRSWNPAVRTTCEPGGDAVQPGGDGQPGGGVTDHLELPDLALEEAQGATHGGRDVLSAGAQGETDEEGWRHFHGGVDWGQERAGGRELARGEIELAERARWGPLPPGPLPDRAMVHGLDPVSDTRPFIQPSTRAWFTHGPWGACSPCHLPPGAAGLEGPAGDMGHTRTPNTRRSAAAGRRVGRRSPVRCSFSPSDMDRRVPKAPTPRYPLRLAAWANNSVGRVPCSQRGSRWFEPSLAHHSYPPSPLIRGCDAGVDGRGRAARDAA